MSNGTKGVIGILTGGGDVPGLNPAIRAVTIRATREGYKVIGIRRGWAGLIDIVRDPQADNSNNFQILTEEIVNRAGRTEKIRARLQMELGENDEIPISVLKELFFEHEAQTKADVERIASDYGSLGPDASKIAEFLQRGRDSARQIQNAPIQFRSRTYAMIEPSYPDKTSEILDLAQQLIRIPSVTASPNERLDEVHRAGSLVDDYLRNAGWK